MSSGLVTYSISPLYCFSTDANKHTITINNLRDQLVILQHPSVHVFFNLAIFNFSVISDNYNLQIERTVQTVQSLATRMVLLSDTLGCYLYERILLPVRRLIYNHILVHVIHVRLA